MLESNVEHIARIWKAVMWFRVAYILYTVGGIRNLSLWKPKMIPVNRND